MTKLKKPQTVNIRVFKADWEKLKILAKADRRTLQDTFSVAVNLASKVHA